MAATGYPENPKVNSDAISYITGGRVLFCFSGRMPLLCGSKKNKVLRSRAFTWILTHFCQHVHICLSYCGAYMCAGDCLAAAHVAQSRPWCLLSSSPPSDLCSEWIKPGLSALDDWSSFQHQHHHWHHTLSPVSCDSAPFLASKCEPHVGSWQPDRAVFTVLKVWTYTTPLSLECKFSTIELMHRAHSKESEMPPFMGGLLFPVQEL